MACIISCEIWWNIVGNERKIETKPKGREVEHPLSACIKCWVDWWQKGHERIASKHWAPKEALSKSAPKRSLV